MMRKTNRRSEGRSCTPRGVAWLIVVLVGPAPAVAQVAPGDTAAAVEPTCRVLGRVLDADSGDPVAGASVWLERADDAVFLAGTGSSRDGSYAIETPACDAAVLRVTMLGYVDAAEPIAFDGADRILQVTIRLERDPVEVEELRVEIPRSLRLRDVGFYARKAWVESTGKDLGQFLDPEEVEGRSAAIHTVRGIVAGTRIRFIYGSGGCAPSYYIDGNRFRSDSSALRLLEYGLRPRDVEGIEIYRPIHGSVPEEYRDPNSNTCGAVVVWTKLGGPGEAPPIEVELCDPSDDPEGVSFGGVVTDVLTGVRLPAAYITLTAGADDPDRVDTTELETVADEDGRYRYCDLVDWPATLRARYGTVTAAPFGIDPERSGPGYWAVDLEVGVVRHGAIVGVVAGEGVELTGIEVALEGTDRAVRPNDRGYFEIRALLPDDYVVVVRRGGEILVRREVSIRSGSTEMVTLDLEVPRS